MVILKYFLFYTHRVPEWNTLKYRSFHFRAIAMACLMALWYPAVCQAEPALVIAGTGDSQGLLREIAGNFMKAHPLIRVEVPDSIGSGGGIKGVLRSRFELGRTARPLKKSEQDGSLVESPFAMSPVVFAVNPSVSHLDNLTPAQIIDIYSRRVTRWDQVGGPAQRIYPVDREAGDSSRRIIEKYMDGFKACDSKAKVFYSTPETVEAIRTHKFTIGFLPIGVARSAGLKILSIDGVFPDPDTLRKGQYPYVTIYSLVFRPPLSARAKKFIDYLHGPATQIIRAQGSIPMEKGQHEPVE